MDTHEMTTTDSQQYMYSNKLNPFPGVSITICKNNNNQELKFIIGPKFKDNIQDTRMLATGRTIGEAFVDSLHQSLNDFIKLNE